MTKMHLMNRFENKMDKIAVLDSKANVPESMRDIIDLLNIANDAYYLYDDPIMSDKRYDDLVEWLEIAEEKTGIIFSSSPLHSVPGKILEGLKKVEHTKPMLSANKTKDMDEIGKFIADKKVVQSWKLDGLTIVVRYEKGKYKQAITRGNGEIGEDVTEAIRHCKNIPLMLNENVDLEVRGECVISWSNFNAINEQLDNAYSHPRNLAAGSVRCLDTNIAKDRYLEYKVFELVNVNGKHMNVVDSFKYLYKLGFDVVEYAVVDNATYMDVDKKFNPEKYDYPVDGCIYKYDSYEYGESLGATSHHPLNMIARKWTDELHETTLRGIDWTLGKAGVITPVAVFDAVEINGSVVERASLHNISIMESILGKPYIGQKIWVYKANSIIPCIDSAEKIEAE